MRIAKLNQLPAAQLTTAFTQCCVAQRWVSQMVQSLPFVSEAQLFEKADTIWAALDEADYLEAFEGHPKIGDVSSLKQKYANTKALASGEQSSVNQASDEVLQRLAAGNHAYEAKFGFIFIVCATGKSAAEMLALLEARLPNERTIEVQNAAEEQRKITRIRLEKLLNSLEVA
ncbi:MAG: 2-oxo-4-hydroxy-4-carboxy-5-ureidoimidazoline decarboxylase [Thiofilum sp.]|uniref:2-oxo-4-hydroxy-4-carboxy-5-ureidoimidazoline decarboxylase n=1 Tax=Thiofilum sp. TaxID=2212733 RepID=UPI0025F43F8C|nr:2-oxo-4-hydroxy-4-carboxy-5-ureidoimidazoline decarboxylase [Thiofilum sp.]MBK8454454.1 2-oxo-4-hydroxy-4-carboxy-5-ureidoimidazoline decarboxylase [Thiofilum sp.]